MNNTLPKGITLDQLKANWDEAYSVYGPVLQRAKLLDATDRGKLWKAIQAKFPAYQLLPDTNHVAYIKNNLLASLYSVGRAAELEPTSGDDAETVKHINLVLQHLWKKYDIPVFQMKAGERAALLNIGITQIGWDNSIIKGTGESFIKGEPVFDNVDPMRFMRDPYAANIEVGAYAMRWDNHHKNVILRNPKYKENMKTYLATNQNGGGPTSNPVDKMTDQPNRASKDRYKIIINWVMDGDKIHEIHTIDYDYVLYVNEAIEPNEYPLVELFCNLPSDDIFGTSEPNRIFANSVVINMLNSILATAELKNQRPPRYVNTESQINLRDFIKHGADSDYVFQVRGDASRAVHYHQFPTASPIIQSILGGLGNDIQTITGVTGKYVGQDTGSILTTGGMEQMLDQATMIDQPKIVNYEHYTKRLTKLLLKYLKAYGLERTYLVKDPRTKSVAKISVDYRELMDTDTSDYSMNISPVLPRNKQRIAQLATLIMEKQIQYNANSQQPVDLITPEEWLMFQELPNDEFMLDRMKMQRYTDYVDKVSKVIFQYTELVDGGMEPDDALLATAESMQSGMPYGQQPAPLDVPPSAGF